MPNSAGRGATLGALLTACAMLATCTSATAAAYEPAPAQLPAPAISASLGPARSLPPGYFGFNFDYAGVREYDGDLAARYSQLAGLLPGTMRYPGGTQANYFQWHLGYPVDPPKGQCLASRPTGGFAFTLLDLKTAYEKTKAPPVFDLNVMTSTLACQIAMLQQAHQDGLPVRYVELGNELYIDSTDNVHYFPTAADYGTTVAAYVKAVHQRFPQAQVAAVGALPQFTQRDRTWNQGMLMAAGQAGGQPDAITLHVYPSYSQALTPGGLPGLFSEPYQMMQQISSVTGALPPRLPTWLTEYNLLPKHAPNSNPAQTSYAQALFVTEMDLLLVHRVPSAQLIQLWAAFGGDASYAYTGKPGNPQLTPGGLALTWVDKAAQGATASRPIVFTSAPVLPGGFPALIGQIFTSAAGSSRILVNLSPSAVPVKAGTAIPAGAPYEQITFAGSPARQVATASKLTISHNKAGMVLTVPAHSIIKIG